MNNKTHVFFGLCSLFAVGSVLFFETLPVIIRSIFLLAYVLMHGGYWKSILEQNIKCAVSNIFRYVIAIGWFAVLLGWIGSFFVVLFGFSIVHVLLTYIVATVLTLFLYFQTSKTKKDCDTQFKIEKKQQLSMVTILGSLIFGIIFCYIFVSIVFTIPSTGIIVSPWEVFSSQKFAYGLFALIFLWSVFVWQKISVSYLLTALIGISFIMHVYIPIVHEFPAGADIWRHATMEQLFLSGQNVHPNVIHDANGNIGLFSLLQTPQKFSYGQLWASMLLIAYTMGISVLEIGKWFVPVVWIPVVPLLSYVLAFEISKHKVMSVMFALASMSAFPLIALGSLTLPVSLGVIMLLYFLWFYTSYRNSQKKIGGAVIVSLIIGSFFLYVLVPIILIAYTAIEFGIKKFAYLQNKIQKNVYTFFAFCLAVGVIPILEFIVLRDYVLFQPSNIIQNVILVVKQLTGWIYFRGWPVGNIPFGNILVSKLSYLESVPPGILSTNFFFAWRGVVLSILLICIGSAVYGWISYIRSSDIFQKSIAWLVIHIMGGYMLGWLFFESEHLLVRRLDPFIALLFWWFAIVGIFLISKLLSKKIVQNIVASVAICMIGYIAVVAWISGPYMRYVSIDEFRAAQKVYDEISAVNDTACVIGNTWSLLALEYISHRKIVGGGFPIDENFGQPERVALYQSIQDTEIEVIIANAQSLIAAQKCYVIVTKLDFENRLQKQQPFAVVSDDVVIY